MNVNISDIEAARELLNNIIIPTPILPDKKLSDDTNVDIYLKAESLQRSGSFKIRGAYNKIAGLSPEEKKRGVIAASAGNHAQGVALAAKLLGIKATIVLPEYAPLTKISATKNLGAEVVMHGSSFDEAMNFSYKSAEENGYIHIHAFDDDKIIAGQGTIGLEIAEELPSANVIVVPIGGGGIISGIAIAVKELIPNARVIGVEAENLAVINPALQAGKIVDVPSKPTIADGIAIKRPGDKTLEIIRQKVDEVVEVSEDEIAEGIFHCIQNNRLVVEGAGAAGVAALLAGKIDIDEHDTVCAVLCGGNIDANLLARILEHILVKEGRYIILKILVQDRPGNLANLLNLVAEKGSNVIEVYHQRAMWQAPLGSVGLEMLLEVRDEDHGQELQKFLKQNGYKVQRETVGNW